MKTHQRTSVNEQTAPGSAPANDLAAIKLFAKDVLEITDTKRIESVGAALHQLSDLMQDPKMKEKVITALKTGNFKNVATAAANAAPESGAAAPAGQSIKEEAARRNSSFLNYLFEETR